jgi:hypothetical protein
MMRKGVINWSLLIIIVLLSIILSGCYSAPKQTIELAEITDEQIAELQKSHIKFVQLYYDKLREDINDFIDNKWTPKFLSKAVQNENFRESLDDAYASTNEPEKLGEVMLGFSKAALKEINSRRTELLTAVDEQERMVINEINGAFADLQRSQAAIKGYLASVVNLKEQQDLTLKKLGVLEKSQQLTNAVLEKGDKFSNLLQSGKDAGEILKQAKQELSEQIQTVGNTVGEMTEE